MNETGSENVKQSAIDGKLEAPPKIRKENKFA
jgi:hypothetical protein